MLYVTSMSNVKKIQEEMNHKQIILFAFVRLWLGNRFSKKLMKVMTFQRSTSIVRDQIIKAVKQLRFD